MPCDTIQLSQVEFLEKSTDTKLLAEALREMGFTVVEDDMFLRFSKWGTNGTYEKKTGRLESRGYESVDVNEVKKKYSKAAVNQKARKFGWQIAWSTNPATGNEEFEVKKRG